MSDLDEKLEDLLVENDAGLRNEDIPSYDYPVIVQEIKQAFKDAGYVQIPSDVKERDGTVNVSHGVVYQNGDRLMTGQAWYDRFWEEYELPEGRKPKYIDSTIVRRDIDMIAKRASRVEL